MTSYTIFPGDHRRLPPQEIAELAARELCHATETIIQTCAKAEPAVSPQRALMAITIGIAFLIKYTAHELGQKGHDHEVIGIMINMIKQHLNIEQKEKRDTKDSFRQDLSELISRTATGVGPDDVCDVLLDTMMLISGGDDATAQ